MSGCHLFFLRLADISLAKCSEASSLIPTQPPYTRHPWHEYGFHERPVRELLIMNRTLSKTNILHHVEKKTVGNQTLGNSIPNAMSRLRMLRILRLHKKARLPGLE